MRRERIFIIAVLLSAVLFSASHAEALDIALFGPDAKVVYSPHGRVRALSGISVDAPRSIKNPSDAARWFLKEYAPVFGLDDRGLGLTERETHYHFDQNIIHFSVELDDLKVFFKKIVVQVDSRNRICRVLTDVPKVKPVRAGHPLIGLSIDEWGERFKFPRETIVGKGWLEVRSDAVRPVVLVDTLETSPLNPMSLFVDASTGRILHSEPIEWTYDPLGAVYPENPVTTPETEIVPIRYLTNQGGRLEGRFARVATCVDTDKCTQVTPLASLQDDGGWNFIYRPSLKEYSFNDPFAEVNVYHNISTINAWIRNTFGWGGLFGDDTCIESRVGRAWYNAAFYAGNDDRDPFMIYGQDVVDFAYDSDVAYHEFGHATNRTLWEHPWMVGDRYGMDAAMFGIEEAFADIWAENLSGDPVMNSYIEAARTADNDHTCPDDLFAEGHYEARILTGFAWDVREAIGATAWEHIVFRTLSFLGSYVRFDSFVETIAQSAEDLVDEQNAGVEPEHVDEILAAAEARGLSDEDCLSRFVPMYEGQTRWVYGYGSRRTGKVHYPFGLQWKMEAPKGAEAALLVFQWLYPTEETVEGVEPGYNVHIRRGSPVEVEWLDIDDLEDGDDAFEVTADLTTTGAPTSIVFPYLGFEPLTEGEPLYVLLSSATEEPTVAMSAEAYFIEKLPLPPGEPVEGERDAGPDPGLDVFAVADNFSCTATNPHTKYSSGGLLLAILSILLDY